MSDQTKNPSIAVLLLVLAVLLQMGIAGYRTYTDKQVLQDAMAQQEEAFGEIRKVRQQLNSIAGKTLQLAQQGNANAAGVIEQMRAAGVNFSPTE